MTNVSTPMAAATINTLADQDTQPNVATPFLAPTLTHDLGSTSLILCEMPGDNPETIAIHARERGRFALDASTRPSDLFEVCTDKDGRITHVYSSEAIYRLAANRLNRTGRDRRLGATESESDAIKAVVDRLCWTNSRVSRVIELSLDDFLDEERTNLWLDIVKTVNENNKSIRRGDNKIRNEIGSLSVHLAPEYVAFMGPDIGASSEEVAQYLGRSRILVGNMKPSNNLAATHRGTIPSDSRHFNYMNRIVPKVHKATGQQYENFNSTACDWIVAQALLGPVYLHVNDGDYTRSTGIPLESNDLPAAILQQQRLGREVHPIYIVNKDISPDQARDCPALRVREAGPDGVRARLEADGSKTLVLDISSAYIDRVKAEESATGVPYDDIMARRLDQYAKSGIDRIEISVNRTDFFDPRAIGWRRQAAEIVQNVNAARDAEMRASSRKPLSSRPNGTVHYEATRSAPFEIFILNGEATQAERDRAQKEILRRSVAVTPLARRAERRGGILESRTNERIAVRSYGGTWRQDTAEADLYRRISDWALAA